MSSSVGASHSFSLDISLPNTPVKTINIENDLTINDTRSHSAMMSSKYEDGAMRYRNVSATDSFHDNFAYSGMVNWRDEDNARISPAVSVNANLMRGNGDSWTVDTLATAFDRRHIHSESLMNETGISAKAGISSVLKNTDDYTLSISGNYVFAYNNRLSRQNTMDLWQVTTPVIDVANTYDYTWNYYDHNAGASLNFNTRNFELNASLGIRYRTQVDQERYPEALSDNYNFLSFTPFLRLSWKRNLQFTFNMSSQTPSLEQLRNRIDDKNPFALIEEILT